MRKRRVAIALCLTIVTLGTSAHAQIATLDRGSVPIVVTGSQIPTLCGGG